MMDLGILDMGQWILLFLAERLGSGDGERKTLLTRQMSLEPLPASALFGLVCGSDSDREVII